MWGMHDYPGYLENRFAEPPRHIEHLDRLLEKMDKQRAKVVEARKRVLARDALLAQYKPLHEEQLLALTAETLLDGKLLEGLRSGSVEKCLTEMLPGVFAIDLLSKEVSIVFFSKRFFSNICGK